jgi:hypothetical protein
MLDSPTRSPLQLVNSSSPGEVVMTGHRVVKAPLHPLFSRSNGHGAHHNPIQIDEDSPQPVTGPLRKLVFAADTKPAHTFFSRPALTLRGKAAESSVGDPEEVEVERIDLAEEPARFHTFFKANGTMSGSPRMAEGWGKHVKDGGERAAPLPGGVWPNHHDGAIGVPSHLSGPVMSRRRQRVLSSVEEDGFWTEYLGRIPGEDGRERYVEQAPCHSHVPFLNRHPALVSLRNKATGANRESWNERFRPQKAVEVLGNEVEATYLRDWLSTLEVGTKGEEGAKKVMRKVKRKKGLGYDDWIVDDIGLFGEIEDVEEEEDEEQEVLELHLDDGMERPNSYASLESRLTNTILLTGPHGSGKSAAVYAVAAELGWDVFEVYPGIGKRTAANLASLVGDVGKNHMVGSQRHTKESVEPKKSEGIKSFFGKAKSLQAFGSQGSAGDPIDLEVDVLEETPAIGFIDGPSGDGKARQSLILIDEVDILFEEESTFWPAVVALIAESRRPVVLTCNGGS